MSDVLAEIKVEREHQDEMWGGAEHDDEHSVLSWYSLVMERIDLRDDTPLSEGRRNFIEIAALAVAAVESIDRGTYQPPSSTEEES